MVGGDTIQPITGGASLSLGVRSDDGTEGMRPSFWMNIPDRRAEAKSMKEEHAWLV